MTDLRTDWTAAQVAGVRGCLERVLASSFFAQAERQQRFLRFIVGETLAGHAERLKGYTIGVEVFDRNPGFDPTVDAIVRVEAARLRAKLREYYEGEGRDDPVRFDLPKGSYAVRVDCRATDGVRYEGADKRTDLSSSFDPQQIEDKPSLAVLPFVNMSPDPEQEYFADGITEDLITDLSQISGLFVIARHSAFMYKGAAKRLQEIQQELGVGYLLEGSVRRSTDRVRVTAQLIDARTGNHLWAERYDRELKEIFAVQDEVTRHIVSALQLRLTSDENRRLAKVGTDSIEAYELCRRGNAAYLLWTADALDMAEQFYERAMVIDPSYAEPRSQLARVHTYRWITGMRGRREESLDIALRLAREAVALDSDLPLAHGVLSWVCTWSGRHEEAVAAARRALALDPGGADIHYWLGVSLSFSGILEEADGAFAEALRLNPHPPCYYHWARAQNYMFMQRYPESIALAERIVREAPTFRGGYVVLAASYALADRVEEARRVGREFYQLFSRVGDYRQAVGIAYKGEIGKRYQHGLELAGI